MYFTIRVHKGAQTENLQIKLIGSQSNLRTTDKTEKLRDTLI